MKSFFEKTLTKVEKPIFTEDWSFQFRKISNFWSFSRILGPSIFPDHASSFSAGKSSSIKRVLFEPLMEEFKIVFIEKDDLWEVHVIFDNTCGFHRR